MTALSVEVSDGLRFLAGPMRDGDKVKSRIARAARAAGLSYWRAFDLWYGRARAIKAQELEAVRAAKARRSQEDSDDLAAIAQDFEELAERVARLASSSDWEGADRMRSIAGRLRRLAS